MAEPPEASPFMLLRPLLLLSYSGYYIPHTITKILLSLDPSPFFNPETFKSIWFARFWAWFGPRAREAAEASVLPLLQNSASGVCLDVGPGSGQWLYMFAKAENPSITKIYGVEPNPGMHAELRQNAIKAGLEDVYEIVPCGAEEIGTKADISKESIDTIITVQCLCSIPDPENVINSLYPYLKPGGKWLVYEHIKTPYQQRFVGFWQRKCVLFMAILPSADRFQVSSI